MIFLVVANTMCSKRLKEIKAMLCAAGNWQLEPGKVLSLYQVLKRKLHGLGILHDNLSTQGSKVPFRGKENFFGNFI